MKKLLIALTLICSAILVVGAQDGFAYPTYEGSCQACHGSGFGTPLHSIHTGQACTICHPGAAGALPIPSSNCIVCHPPANLGLCPLINDSRAGAAHGQNCLMCHTECVPPPENCSNGSDDDGDGYIDCADPDCETQSCADGVFCNGIDTCQSGQCVHSGDPCAGYTCDEIIDVCVSVGCMDNSQCGSVEFCAKAPGDCNGIGQCTIKPTACPDIYDPVCGCDGNTYDNACYANQAGVNIDYAGPCIIPIACTAKVEKNCVISANCGTVPYTITVYNTTLDQEIYCTVSDSNPNLVAWTPALPIPPATITVAQGSTFLFNGIYTCDPQVCPYTLDPNTVTIDCKNAAGETCTADPSGALEDTAQNCKCEKVEEPKACWLTAGGVKFEPLTGKRMATVSKGSTSGTGISIGGNVNPACSPTAGDGGNWTHLDHKAKLFFQSRHIEVVECSNIPESIRPPGADSPKTPFNYIEFKGIGTLKGISGNKTLPDGSLIPMGTVYFYARAEDRNEPGSDLGKLGSMFTDRYWIAVFADAAMTQVLYRFPYVPPGNEVTNPDTICGDDAFPCTDTVAISGGNLQIHVSSCDSYN